MIVDTVNSTSRTWPAETLYEGLFRFASNPATAQLPVFIAGDRLLSFFELARQATQLAAYLNENGVGPSDHVVVRGKPSLERVVAIYAVLIAGASYVPVSTAAPLTWAHAINRQAAVTTVLGDDDEDIKRATSSPVMWSLNYTEFLRKLPEDCAFLQPTYPVPASQCAYIMFGHAMPALSRGVAVAHEAAMNALQDAAMRFAVQPGDRLLASSDTDCDISIFDLFMPVVAGCATVLSIVERGTPDEPVPDTLRWIDAMACATIWASSVAQMEQILSEADRRGTVLPPSLRLVLTYNDWPMPSLMDRLAAHLPQARLAFMSGVPEAALWSSMVVAAGTGSDCSTADTSVLPISNMRLYVLDKSGHRCPQGVVGTLHIAGVGLALGHVDGAEFITSTFRVDKQLGERLCPTVHSARCSGNGVIELMGTTVEKPNLSAKVSAPHPESKAQVRSAHDGPAPNLPVCASNEL